MRLQFTFSIVGFHGTGLISYREALAAVFMEGRVLAFPLHVVEALANVGGVDGFSSSSLSSVFVNGWLGLCPNRLSWRSVPGSGCTLRKHHRAQ